ncbi:MAG TPA: sigma 54-interacting transcriptional regulator [Burkholderiaceae bacterium]|nr:sigma 54-interacting transcriptional regulator [Burkholderiaceae bacterium]
MKKDSKQHMTDETARDKVLELMTKRLNHPHIHKVIQEVEALETLGPNHILMVTGPTGVGKTTLTHILRNRLLKRYEPLMQQDPGAIPVLLTESLPQNARALLVLESKLPQSLIPLRNMLGVEVIEGVSPKNG